MARINIEEKWWTDPRRKALTRALGDDLLADGLTVQVWRLGQEYWKQDRRKIPKTTFELLPHFELLLKFDIVRVDAEGYYVSGTREFAEWTAVRRDAGSLGGRKSAESRRSDSNNLTVANAKQKQATIQQTQPSGSVSGSGSVEIEEKNSSNSSAVAVVAAPRNRTTQIFSRDDFFDLLHPYLADWSEIYPDKEYLNQEVGKGIVWLKANPTKNRKTQRGWVQFWGGWFDRGWDKSRTRGPSNKPEANEINFMAVAIQVLDRVNKYSGQELQTALGDYAEIVTKAGIARIRAMPPGAYQVKGVADLLKAATQF